MTTPQLPLLSQSDPMGERLAASIHSGRRALADFCGGILRHDRAFPCARIVAVVGTAGVGNGWIEAARANMPGAVESGSAAPSSTCAAAKTFQSGPALIVAKHQSAWDTFALIPLFRDPAVVLKDELKWIPFYGWFCVKFAHILVKRAKASVALKTLIRDAKSRVAGGRQILIFPEGTRTAPGAPPDFKPGYMALYEALGVPAVPLALNSGLYWPRRSLWRYPGTIVVEILPAIAPGMARAAFRTESRDGTANPPPAN